MRGGSIAPGRIVTRHYPGDGGLGDRITGKRFSLVRDSTVLELEAGKIRRESDYWDAATFMKQVAVLLSR